MANLGWDEVRLPNPLFEGDTVYSRSEVLEKRESKSRPNVGIVKVRTIGFTAGRHDRDRVPAHVHGLQARSRAARRSREDPGTEEIGEKSKGGSLEEWALSLHVHAVEVHA